MSQILRDENLVSRTKRAADRSAALGREKHRPFLTAKTDADRGERAIEIAIVSFADVDAAIHCAEEKIGAVSKADAGVRVME